ncbi:MAG: macro domain-containing protein [Thermoplasmata archaeon]|nr:macro domain-containing protein [Thermoplasmata archaeon]
MTRDAEQFVVGNLEVLIKQGDITEERVDAIVNAANNHFWMGAGVAGAIKRKGGSEIEKEAVKKGPVEAGQCIYTSAGKLNARYVIHAAVMGQDLVTDEGLIASATANALKLAETLQIQSIAFPALGTGVGGFEYSRCAEIMLGEVSRFRPENLKKVVFVLYGQEAFDVFLSTARKLYG